jgi:hypothetical protein
MCVKILWTRKPRITQETISKFKERSGRMSKIRKEGRTAED